MMFPFKIQYTLKGHKLKGIKRTIGFFVFSLILTCEKKWQKFTNKKETGLLCNIK